MAKDSSARDKRSVSRSFASGSKGRDSGGVGSQAGVSRDGSAKNVRESGVDAGIDARSARTPSRLPKIEPRGTIKVGKVTTREAGGKAGSASKAAAAPKATSAPKAATTSTSDAAKRSGIDRKPTAKVDATPSKPAAKQAPAAAARPAAKIEAKPVAKAPVKPAQRPETKSESKSESKSEAKIDAKSQSMPESTRRAIASATPRQVVEQPPARQLGLRATRPTEVANVRPLEMRSQRQSDGRAPKGSADINGYGSAVRYLLERTDFERMRSVKYNETTFKLERMEQLLAKLGNPHKQIRTVHVAGTNGKGSTVAMIGSMLQACGYTVGIYTSPHLVDLRERIIINGQMIDKAVFAELMKHVAKAAEKAGVEPTFFEAVTAVCLKHFAEQAVDIAIVEVGLGGRLDSTNVIRPEACVITSIDFDHMKLLGNTLEEIAREKAGIFKRDVPAFIFESEPGVERAIAEVAEKAGAPLRIVNKDIDYSARFCVTDDLGPHTRVCLYTKTSRLEHLPVPLPGEHMASNCGLALAVVDHLKTVGFDCPEDKITAGLAATRVPGRMQLVWDRPRVLVDGAHNPAALGALMRCVGAHVPYDSMICVFGCCSDKDVPALIDKVNLGADKVIFTRAANNPRAADPEDLQKLFNERSGKMSQVAKTLPEALEMATRAVSREDLVCVTGSFYLVGETLKHLQHFDRSKGGKIPAQVPES
jgi:dihydrofolate synthase/folylpolyglutamate synthase